MRSCSDPLLETLQGIGGSSGMKCGLLYSLLKRIVLEVRNAVGVDVLVLTQSQQTLQSSLLSLRHTVE